MPAALRTNSVPVLSSMAKAEPFRSAEEAWIWTMSALIARHEGARIVAGAGSKLRPCEPDDVVKCLDRLYRQRRIDLVHARIMRLWGERGMAPDPRQLSERNDWRIWNEAMQRMDWPLRMKGIVAGEAPLSGMAQVVELAARSVSGEGE
jgi:hypothetical protein